MKKELPHFNIGPAYGGTWRWFDLSILWNTGYDRKGGLILFSQAD